MSDFQLEDGDSSVLAILIAIILSHRRSFDEILWLSAFTSVISNSLALIAIEIDLREQQAEEQESEKLKKDIADLKQDIEKLSQEIKALKSSSS